MENKAGEIAAGVAEAAAAVGFAVVGGFRASAEDGFETSVRSVLLLGPSGPQFWAAFEGASELRDGAADPLDRYSRRVGDAMAARFGAEARYPFGGPPYQPFLRWAQRAGGVWPSVLGMFVHAERGLWISYRVALLFRDDIASPAPKVRERPCDSCAGRPCLSACPVDAFAGGVYDAARCAAHVRGAAGRDCRERGCLARRACPVGAAFQPAPAQAAFHMAAFLRNH